MKFSAQIMVLEWDVFWDRQRLLKTFLIQLFMKFMASYLVKSSESASATTTFCNCTFLRIADDFSILGCVCLHVLFPVEPGGLGEKG